MTQPIENIITQIAAVYAAMVDGSGNRLFTQAPTWPPNNIGSYTPAAVTYLANMHLDNGPIGTRRIVAAVATDVLIPLRRLDDDMHQLTLLHDYIHAALQAEISGVGDLFTGSMTAWDGGLTVTWIPQVAYGDVAMRGYRYLMEGIKLLVST